jgi:hypothetical protein
MADFYNIFGEQPSYIPSLLGEDEADRLRKQAQQSGLMNLGLSLLAGAGPQSQRQGIGQLLAQGVMAGQQASRNAYEQAVRDQLMQEQIAERQQARQEQKLAQTILPQILRPGQELYGEDIMGQKVGVGVGAPQLDMATLQKLLTAAPSVAAKVLPTIETYRKLAAPETQKLEKLATGERLINPVTGQIVATGEQKEKAIHYQDLGDVVVGIQDGKEVSRFRKGRPPEGPASKQLVETAQGYVVFDPKTTTVAPVTLGGQPLLGKEGKPNEAQLNAAGFAQRMAASEQIVNKPEIAAASPGTGTAAAEMIPFVGKGVANVVQSPETQMYSQAARDWIRAKLRKESGAAIGVDEEANEFRTYFPMPGDSQKVIEQKAQARARAIQSMSISAGPALKETIMKKPDVLKTPQELAAEELKRRRGQ